MANDTRYRRFLESKSAQGPREAKPRRSSLAGAVFAMILGLALSLLIVVAVAVALLFNRVVDPEAEIKSQDTLFQTNILQLQQSILQQRTISYWLAYPGPQTLVMNPPFVGGIAQGLLKPAEEGLSAILLVAGLTELQPSSSYDLWLSGGGRTVHAGALLLDATGWGTSTVYFDEPLSNFESAELTLRVQEITISRDAAGPVVLEGTIP